MPDLSIVISDMRKDANLPQLDFGGPPIAAKSA